MPGIVGVGDAARPRLGGMVNLTRIYTRTGDDGTTALGGRGRISKNDPRLEAYADCDEAERRPSGSRSPLGDARPTTIAARADPGAERPLRRRRRPVHAGRAATRSTRRCGSTQA